MVYHFHVSSRESISGHFDVVCAHNLELSVVDLGSNLSLASARRALLEVLTCLVLISSETASPKNSFEFPTNNLCKA